MNPKINLLISNLNKQLNFVDFRIINAIQHSKKAIEMTAKSLYNLKTLTVKNKFSAQTGEVIFFQRSQTSSILKIDVSHKDF